MGMVDNTLFTKKKSSNLIIIQIYVGDIIFGSTYQDMCDEFSKIMHDEFEMSMMGELNFFFGLQIKQMKDGIFFNQSKYIKEMLKKFGLEESKPMKTPMSSGSKLTKDEECESVDSTKYPDMIGTYIETVVYADSDHAGDYVDRKSTSGICTFMGCCLTSWFSKKQTALAISTTEAEYVNVKKACQQALWMKQALIDYDVAFCLGLRFALLKTFYCVLLRTDSAKLKTRLRFVYRFCCVLLQESCVLSMKHCALPKLRILSFVYEALRFVQDLSLPLRKCILSGPYKPTTILVQAVDATDDSLAIPEHTTVETPMNMSPENKSHFEAKKEAIHLILTGIGDEIYSIVDACQTAQEMWETIERLQQGKEIAKPITPPSEADFEEDSDPEQAQRDKDMQKNLALIAKHFKNIYKPTNNNLRTSSNSRNKNVDTTSRYKNDDHSGQFGKQRTVNVAGTREKVGSPVVHQSGIQCFNCKEFVHFAKECRKPKRVKDSAYQKEKMLLCKQAEQGFPLQAEQYDWLADMDEEVDEQELEAHYSYMAKIQEVPTADIGIDSEPVEQVHNDARYNVFANDPQHYEQSESISYTCLVETDDSSIIPDSPDMCEDDIQNDQNDVESDDERVALANLIANLKLDVNENKKIQKQLKKANTTLAQELKECKAILAETSKSLEESKVFEIVA
nr:retrovirus-related Pol polyprotein from transposon TNT 1-94 [Tanacetum cinerariifolium]